MNTKLCKCGCGEEIVESRNGRAKFYISGHNGKGIIRVERMQHVCIHCGKGFEDMPHRGKRTFCSNQCRDDYRREHKGKRNLLYKERVKANCFVCGKEIYVLPSRVGRTKRISCSPECGHKIRIAVINTIKRNGYGKQAAIVRDGGKCVICGFSHVVTVHHIIPKRSGGGSKLTNLVTLCPNHHYMVHAGILKTDELKKFATDFLCSADDRKAYMNMPSVEFRKVRQ